MAKGWRGESRRHSLASKGVKTAMDKSSAMSKVPQGKPSLEQKLYREARAYGKSPVEALELSKKGYSVALGRIIKDSDGNVIDFKVPYYDKVEGVKSTVFAYKLKMDSSKVYVAYFPRYVPEKAVAVKSIREPDPDELKSVMTKKGRIYHFKEKVY